MEKDIDKMRNDFFKKSLLVGHHNVKYTWMQLMLMIISCVRSLESFEEGAKSPSAQTLRDRLNLEGAWLASFHASMWNIAKFLLRKFCRYKWWISIDETYAPFFGSRKKLNEHLKKIGLGKFVHGYRAKTPGATGSFCFLVISLCCCKVRIPMAIKMVRVGERYKPWLEPWIIKLNKLAPKAIVLADRGFGKAVWFYDMLDSIGVKYNVRIPLRKKENKNKVAAGVSRFQYWMKEDKSNNSVLLTVYVARDDKKRMYLLASNIKNKTNKQLLDMYLNRWDLENIFKDADRVELPTSSRNPRMRLFCVVLSFFLFALWQVEMLLSNVSWSLRTFVKYLLMEICNYLECFVNSIGELLFHPP
jgi:hypothetical protein